MIEAEQSRRTLRRESALVRKNWRKLKDLQGGLRDKIDPVTVRTFLLDTETLMDVDNPEWEEIAEENWHESVLFLNYLTRDTLWKPLNPEYLDAMGVKSNDIESYVPRPLKLAVANGRHKAEPLWSGLAEYMDEKFPGEVAKFNPVGHYNDKQPRVAGIRRLFRNVDTLAVLGSTQRGKGGSLEVISHVARLVRNIDFSSNINNIAIVMPFIGGSRGHRLGQRDNLVYEILEMISNPKIFGLALINARERMWVDRVGKKYNIEISPKGSFQTLLDSDTKKIKELQDGVTKGEIPTPEDLLKLKVVTVDIHNDELPARKFNEMGIEFINADPTPETAKATIDFIRSKKMMDKIWLLMASDGGAIPRTEKYALEMLMQSGKNVIYVGNIDKTRTVAGKVDKVEMGKIEKWTLKDGVVIREQLSEEERIVLFEDGVVLIKNDDMIDTGGTNEKDEKYLRGLMKVLLSITVATHPVFSHKVTDLKSLWQKIRMISLKRFKILDKIGSDMYIFTNTLIHNGLTKRDDVVIVDAAPSIARALNIE